MKIINNKKDYYDYLAGIYGIDDQLIYDRRDFQKFQHLVDTGVVSSNFNNFTIIDLKIGRLGYSLQKRFKNGTFDEDPKEDLVIDDKWNFYTCKPLTNEQVQELRLKEKNLPPIFMRLYTSYGTSQYTLIKNPIISTFPYFASYIPPEVIWNEVSNFIAMQKEKTIIDSRTDVQKLESHGFNKKTSFRKI